MPSRTTILSNRSLLLLSGRGVPLLMVIMLWSFTGKYACTWLSGIIAAVTCLLFLSSRFRQQLFTTIDSHCLGILFLFFLCMWLPQCIALLDSINFPISSRYTAFYPRFLFCAILLIYLSRRSDNAHWIHTLSFWTILFWCLDAWWQYFSGTNLIGYPHESGHITGMFYPRSTIAHVCAILSPIFFEYIRRNYRRWPWLLLSLIPLVTVIFLSGRRAAWIMLFLASLGYMILLLRHSPQPIKTIRRLLFLGCISTVAIILFWASDEAMQSRMENTLLLGSMNYEKVNTATSWRLPIWETSWHIWLEHPFNGIGVRGFRDLFWEYIPERHIGIAWPVGHTAHHPHLIAAEILVETGIIGFIAYLFFLGYLLKQFWLIADRNTAVVLLSLLLLLFPLNAHMAIYGSYLSALLWWLLILFFLSPNRLTLESK